MKIFNLKRLAYFDELADDPETSEVISNTIYLEDWIPGTIGDTWNPAIGGADRTGHMRKTSKYVSIFDDRRISINFNNGEFNIHEDSVDYYYNVKHDCMLFIRKDIAPKIAANGGLIKKIELVVSKILEKRNSGMTTSVSISDIENDNIRGLNTSGILMNSIRLSYFEELENDPQVKDAIKNQVLSRFTMNLSDYDKWNPSVIDDIFGLQLIQKDFALVVPGKKWGRVWHRGNNEFAIERNTDAGGFDKTILAAEGYSIWDNDTERLLFIQGTSIQNKLKEDEAFKIEFLYHLAQAIDSGSNRFKLK